MKYVELASLSTPTAVSTWFQDELVNRGVDAAYTFYVLSLLKQPLDNFDDEDYYYYCGGAQSSSAKTQPSKSLQKDSNANSKSCAGRQAPQQRNSGSTSDTTKAPSGSVTASATVTAVSKERLQSPSASHHQRNARGRFSELQPFESQRRRSLESQRRRQAAKRCVVECLKSAADHSQSREGFDDLVEELLARLEPASDRWETVATKADSKKRSVSSSDDGSPHRGVAGGWDAAKVSPTPATSSVVIADSRGSGVNAPQGRQYFREKVELSIENNDKCSASGRVAGGSKIQPKTLAECAKNYFDAFPALHALSSDVDRTTSLLLKQVSISGHCTRLQTENRKSYNDSLKSIETSRSSPLPVASDTLRSRRQQPQRQRVGAATERRRHKHKRNNRSPVARSSTGACDKAGGSASIFHCAVQNKSGAPAQQGQNFLSAKDIVHAVPRRVSSTGQSYCPILSSRLQSKFQAKPFQISEESEGAVAVLPTPTLRNGIPEKTERSIPYFSLNGPLIAASSPIQKFSCYEMGSLVHSDDPLLSNLTRKFDSKLASIWDDAPTTDDQSPLWRVSFNLASLGNSSRIDTKSARASDCHVGESGASSLRDEVVLNIPGLSIFTKILEEEERTDETRLECLASTKEADENIEIMADGSTLLPLVVHSEINVTSSPQCTKKFTLCLENSTLKRDRRNSAFTEVIPIRKTQRSSWTEISCGGTSKRFIDASVGYSRSAPGEPPLLQLGVSAATSCIAEDEDLLISSRTHFIPVSADDEEECRNKEGSDNCVYTNSKGSAKTGSADVDPDEVDVSRPPSSSLAELSSYCPLLILLDNPVDDVPSQSQQLVHHKSDLGEQKHFCETGTTEQCPAFSNTIQQKRLPLPDLETDQFAESRPNLVMLRHYDPKLRQSNERHHRNSHSQEVRSVLQCRLQSVGRCANGCESRRPLVQCHALSATVTKSAADRDADGCCCCCCCCCCAVTADYTSGKGEVGLNNDAVCMPWPSKGSLSVLRNSEAGNDVLGVAQFWQNARVPVSAAASNRLRQEIVDEEEQLFNEVFRETFAGLDELRKQQELDLVSNDNSSDLQQSRRQTRQHANEGESVLRLSEKRLARDTRADSPPHNEIYHGDNIWQPQHERVGRGCSQDAQARFLSFLEKWQSEGVDGGSCIKNTHKEVDKHEEVTCTESVVVLSTGCRADEPCSVPSESPPGCASSSVTAHSSLEQSEQAALSAACLLERSPESYNSAIVSSVRSIQQLQRKRQQRAQLQYQQYQQSRKPCTFYMEGNCRRIDCKFSHELAGITCRFWEEGSCFKGFACPFLHGYAPPTRPAFVDDNTILHSHQTHQLLPQVSSPISTGSFAFQQNLQQQQPLAAINNHAHNNCALQHFYHHHHHHNHLHHQTIHGKRESTNQTIIESLTCIAENNSFNYGTGGSKRNNKFALESEQDFPALSTYKAAGTLLKATVLKGIKKPHNVVPKKAKKKRRKPSCGGSNGGTISDSADIGKDNRNQRSNHDGSFTKEEKP